MKLKYLFDTDQEKKSWIRPWTLFKKLIKFLTFKSYKKLILLMIFINGSWIIVIIHLSHLLTLIDQIKNNRLQFKKKKNFSYN